MWHNWIQNEEKINAILSCYASISRTLKRTHTIRCNQNDRNRGKWLTAQMQQIILSLSLKLESVLKPNLLHVQSDKIYRSKHETRIEEMDGKSNN